MCHSAHIYRVCLRVAVIKENSGLQIAKKRNCISPLELGLGLSASVDVYSIKFAPPLYRTAGIH